MTLPNEPYETLRVGVIQTSLDYKAAWVQSTPGNWKSTVQMSMLEENRARMEIRRHLSSFQGREHSPDIVLLPELSVPIGFKGQLKRVAESMEALFIAGLDYKIETSTKGPTVSNEAVVIVPRKLRGTKIAQRTELRYVGKTYPSPAEKEKLQKINVKFSPKPTVWLFNSKMLGDFAVAVCYDFLDLDRIVLYRNRIQTLFILAYNKDTTTFNHVAEAISRMVFCNVVICNCGYYGGSFAVTPYRDAYKRTIFHHSGKNLQTAQIIELPLASLIEHQKDKNQKNKCFKSHPPGYFT